MSTPLEAKTRGLDEPNRAGVRIGERDAAQEVALVAGSRRALLLGAHRHRLRREDLEDCYSQATLELLVGVARGRVFANRLHLARALEQRFLSRIHDRRRAVSGRSPMQAAMEQAGAIGDGLAFACEAIADPRAEPERLALLRDELAQIARQLPRLTVEQRLVLASQVVGIEAGEFCRLHRWSLEKYRKVAQRARARLRRLIVLDEASVPPAARPSEQPAGTDL